MLSPLSRTGKTDIGVAEISLGVVWVRLLKSERRERRGRVVYNESINSNLGDNDDNANSWFIECV